MTKKEEPMVKIPGDPVCMMCTVSTDLRPIDYLCLGVLKTVAAAASHGTDADLTNVVAAGFCAPHQNDFNRGSIIALVEAVRMVKARWSTPAAQAELAKLPRADLPKNEQLQIEALIAQIEAYDPALAEKLRA